jgi:hypothetical protein
MTSTRCQRAICGAKNFSKAPIYLKQRNYFLATVEDELGLYYANASASNAENRYCRINGTVAPSGPIVLRKTKHLAILTGILYFKGHSVFVVWRIIGIVSYFFRIISD